MNPVVVTGFITVGAEAVARIEQREIRGRSKSFNAAPGFRFTQPGLRRNK
jgi:hypothetical protein